MSKITNDGLTRSGTGCFIAVPHGNSGRQRVLMSVKSNVSAESVVLRDCVQQERSAGGQHYVLRGIRYKC